jgi:Mn-containing catalase
MLLTGINGDLKDAADNAEIMQLLDGKGAKEEMIHKGIVNPEFFIGSAGAPAFTNSQGCAWTANYINGDVQGDLTSDLRSDIAAETRAKMVYEYLLQFTDDPEVKNTLQFLMAREVAHFQMFQQALNTIEPNFPPGILQGDPRYTNQYFNLSTGNDFRGPWNQGPTGPTPELSETFQFIDDPITYCLETNGLRDLEPEGTNRTVEGAQELSEELGEIRSAEVNTASATNDMQWNEPASTSSKNGTKANGKQKTTAKSNTNKASIGNKRRTK